MRIYLSARFERQSEMQIYGEQLRAESVEVVSHWTNLDLPSSDGFSGIAPPRRALDAMMRVEQVVKCNVLVMFSDAQRRLAWSAPDPRGERHWEAGIALALGKRVLVVGPTENVFEDLPDVEHFAEWPECVARILELEQTDALTTRQAAEEAGVTAYEIRKWIASGELMAPTRDGRYVISRNDIDRVKARKRRAAAEKAGM
jgi:hypothetical protein